MVTNHTQNPDAGAGQPFNTPGKLAVGFKEVILVLDHIPGEDHRIHRAGDRLIDDAVPDTRRSNVLARPMSSSGNRLGAAPK